MENLVTSDSFMYISVGICALSMTVSAWGLAKVFGILIETIGRNPQVKSSVQTLSLIAAGLIEAIALYALVIAILMLNK